jgi:hypothetical protein
MLKTVFFAGENFSCTLKIEIKDKNSFKSLSIVGTCFTGKKLLKSEKNLLGWGQIQDQVKEIIPARLYEIWKRWHLNDMRAGTFVQEEILRQAKASGVELNDYDDACNYLQRFDALVDDGYKYGSKWLKEELPQEVIDYVCCL